MINYLCAINVTANEENILLNSYSNNKKSLINTLVIITKQYIYSSKCRETELNFYDCMTKISDWYNVEKYLCENEKQYHKVTTKWQDIF